MFFKRNLPAGASAKAGKGKNINNSGSACRAPAKKMRSVLGFWVFCFAISLILFPGGGVKGQQIMVGDEEGKVVWERIVNMLKTNEDTRKAEKKADEGKKDGLLEMLGKTVTNAVKKIAYDAATYIGSGNKGQEPLWISESWGTYLTNIGDEAAGEFIERVGKDNGIMEFNLCEPDFAVKMKIGLGLVQHSRPKKPACTFKKMVKNWDEELRQPDFLPKFQDVFNPTSNDLGIALSLQTNMIESISLKNEEGKNIRLANKGWLNAENIADESKGPPYISETLLGKSLDTLYSTLDDYTGGSFKEVFNIFINQLAITYVNRKLKEMNVDDITSPVEISDTLFRQEVSRTTEGVSGIKERFAKLLQPDFTVRGDYNILSELTMCPNPNKAGPTNCVITDNFRQAVADKLTVGEALAQGYLNANGVFGFTADGLEPTYREGYPYRSMLILRKFRIIPAGWEVAAHHISRYINNINLDGEKNLGDLVACFDKEDDYKGFYSTWCKGLVDPNWVLKAPLNYCKRAGSGPEIISKQITGKGANSKLVISRNDNYCADEQSCIKEYDDGSCQFYGYCSEEKRKWKFNGESCEPKYNTCQTFRSRDSRRGGTGGQTVSYLENTLDYGSCSMNNAGCKWYCQDYDYSGGAWDCDIDGGNKIYLDKDAEECSAAEEGCGEFIRTKPGIGANLLPNSSFEDINLLTDIPDDNIGDNFNFWGNIGQSISADSYEGLLSLNLSADLNKPITVGPPDYTLDGQTYTLSFYAKDCGGSGEFGIDAKTDSLNTTDEWKYFSISSAYEEKAVDNQINIKILSFQPLCVIDAIKLERGNGTAYSAYWDKGLVYERVAPDYLNCDGIDDPEECDNFAAKCKRDDVGCEMYTSKTNGMNIPAKAAARDYCAAECVGYNVYVQKPSSFDSRRDAYFIPSTADACGVETAGCDEFTNLDAVAKGGEGLEYYSYLRRCVKPSDANADCSNFYTWEGSDETGYQLRVFQYQTNTLTGEPAVTEDDSALCSETIFNLPASDPQYNSDCREFYDSDGGISYHLYTRAITCADNCFPYRRTEKNNDPNLDAGACASGGDGTPQYAGTADSQFNWDGDLEVCYFCKNGGYWNREQSACIYDAIPGEGKSCSAEQAGCREYAGNTGNNIRTILNSDFEGSTQGWEPYGSLSLSLGLSNNSLMAGGNSLFVPSNAANLGISFTIGQLAVKGKSYVLSFIAKAETGPVELSASIDNKNGTVDDFNGNADLIVSDWRYFKLNMGELNHDISEDEALVISGMNAGGFYIDDVKLMEIIDRHFLIKNSWLTPDSCFEDIFGNPVGALYNLGCDEYADRDNFTYYLRGFDHLCLESAVGCELLIDTRNFADYGSRVWYDSSNPLNGICDSDEPDCVLIQEDNYIYAVYDSGKECAEEDKGCQFMGESYKYGDDVLFKDIYLKNNPDKYGSILCNADGERCEEWTTGSGASYFKDPGDQVCEWRQKYGETLKGWGWYKKKVKRCDDDGSGNIDNNEGEEIALCFDDDDCGAGISCIIDENDYDCAVDLIKTFGYGGYDSQVAQPGYENGTGFWIGLCPASQSGCAEYIDPISNFSGNILFNSDFSEDTDGDNIADGWSASADGQQNIPLDSEITPNPNPRLDPYTLYILTVEGSNKAAIEVFDITGATAAVLASFNPVTNSIGSLEEVIEISSLAGERRSVLFYASAMGIGDTVTITARNAGVANGSNIELKKAVIDYQLKQELDKEACNGIVNFEDGCVLFNERSQNGARKTGLIWDANLTYNDGIGLPPAAGSAEGNNANSLLKVRPDRDCGQWLACRGISSTDKEKVCLGVGICDRLNDNGMCDRFVDSPDPDSIPQNQRYPSIVDSIGDISGYAKIGHSSAFDINFGNNTYPYYNDYYKFGEMETFGVSASILNWDFEDNKETDSPDAADFGDPDIPSLGWVCDRDASNEYICEAIDDPVEAQDENVCFKKENKNCYIYAPSGRSFLKITSKGGSNYAVSTMPGYEISIGKDREHMLTAYINTDKITDGKAQLSIIGFTDQGASLEEYDSGITRLLEEEGVLDAAEFDSSSSRGWRLIAFSFTTGPETTAIKIKLSFTGGSSGSYYIDNIKIKPMLKSRDNWKTRQSCQLYPLDDSLSCEYYGESGIRYKGKYGYCLEYDRYPGSSDACLLWWPIPDGADRVNEYCGNGIVDGEEDCDCGKNIDGEEIYDCFSGPLPYGALNTPINLNDTDTPNPYGAHKYNQYRCVSCLWTEGWCGDGITQSSTNSEHCDWNDIDAGNPNLKEQTCWSDHSVIGDTEDQNQNHYAQEDFSHDNVSGDGGATYLDYLRGDLACYNNSDLAMRCRFDASGCSDNLVNDQHTRKQCIDAEGVVVKEVKPNTNGTGNGNEVTYPAGHPQEGQIINHDALGNDYNYFCKFGDGANVLIDIGCADDSAADNIASYCAGKNMLPYKSWSAGKGQRCQGLDAAECIFRCEDTTECNSTDYVFQNNGNDSNKCEYDDATIEVDWGCVFIRCGSETQTNLPDITAVGCY